MTRGAASRPALRRELGVGMATALVIGNVIGSGVFLLPSSLAAEAGPASLVAWVFTGAGAMLLVDRQSFLAVNLVRSSVVALLALAYSSWAIWGAGQSAVAAGFMLVLAGVPIFLVVTWRGRTGQRRGSRMAATPRIF